MWYNEQEISPYVPAIAGHIHAVAVHGGESERRRGFFGEIRRDAGQWGWFSTDTKYLKQIALYILTTVISVGLILYIGYHMFKGLTQRVETAPATIETFIGSEDTDFYIFRDETPLVSSRSGGSRVPAVADGERVAVGATVSRLYDVSSPDIVAQIEGLDRQLDILSRMRDSHLSVRDTAAVDQTIYSVMQKIAAAGYSGDCGNIASLRAELAAALNQRTLLTGTSADLSAAIDSLTAERAGQIARLGTCREQYTVSQSGYYYADCDGYEGIFTADTALHMTPEEFEQLTLREPDPVPSGSVGKLATDYLWYAACFMPREKAASFAVGEEYTIAFPYNSARQIRMTLERVESYGERTMLVFSSGTNPPSFHFLRCQPASVARMEYTGLKIAASALRVVDGVSGVYIREGSIIHFRAVRILVEKEDYCIVENEPETDPPSGCTWLACNDIVITKGRGLYEGRVLS